MAEPIDDNLDPLIDRYLAGELSEPDAAMLLSRLEHDPAAGHRLLEQLHIDAMLHEIADTPSARGTGVSPTFPVPQAAETGRSAYARSTWPLSIGRWVAVAACVLIAIGVAFYANRPAPVVQKPDGPLIPVALPDEATTASVAVLSRAVDDVWRTDPGSFATPPRVGSALEPGWLRLDAGLVQIEFFNGAQLVLEGPAELQLLSASSAYCRSGKLRADVPPQARGFRITTPQINVVDLGTSFGVEVSPAAAQVHVFKGTVELHEKNAADPATPVGLADGEAATVDAAGAIRRLSADASAFASPAELDRRLTASHRRWLARWQSAGDAADADPSLLFRFDFENAGSGDRTLANRASAIRAENTGNSRVADAAIVGSGWSEGRWPGKGALEFRGVGDRVRVEVPGEYTSFTYAAWVRVHGLDRHYNSLFMSDAFDAGATHWQILRDGRVRLGIGGSKPQDTDSPIVFSPERLGQWIHVAVVYDSDAKQITHYVDGRPVKRSAMQPRTLTIGRAELGNWNPATRADGAAIRHFSGRIDEFWAYGRPLADREIAAMYAVGAGLTETVEVGRTSPD